MSKDELVTLIRAYLEAYRAQDAEGCARAFATDGALYSPFDPPAQGREAIASTHSQWWTVREEDKRLELMEFHDHGESGHCLLRWSARVAQDGAPNEFKTESGLSLCVLTTAGGQVLFHRLALIPDPA